uniref:Ankyrin repeat domain 26 n=1 Tax=Molossus molossus TaxID=27622 RepID=A0A7J8JS46_MOLMO|nr:hypothetical protein HJG59_000716 [Molossus molossus]
MQSQHGSKHKDDLTPLSLAQSENKDQIVEILVKRGARIHAVDEMKSNQQLPSEYKEERTPKKSSETSKSVVNESSEEDSLRSKPDIDDSWPTSDDEDLEFDTKNFMKPSLAKLMTAIQQSQKNIEAKYAIVRPENRTSYEDNNFHSENEDVVDTLPNTSEKLQGFSQGAFSSLEPLLKASSMSSTVIGLTKEEATKPAIKKKESGIDIESALQNQTNNENLIYVDGEHKNNSDNISALGLGEDEDIESPWDSESSSEGLPQKYVDYLSVAADQREKNKLNGQVEDSPEKYSHSKPTLVVKDPVPNRAVGVKDITASRSELDLEVRSQEEQERLDGSENHHRQVEEEKQMHRSSEVEVTENSHHADVDNRDGLIQQRKSGQTDNQQFSDMENEDSDWFTLEEKEKRKNTNLLYDKIREQLRKEEQYIKEVEVNQQLETTVRTLEMELKIVRKNLNQVSDNYEKEYLLHENHMLQDENAKLRLEIDTVKNQNQEMEKKYFEDIKIVKEKNEHLHKTIKHNEEILTKTIFQHNEQLNIPTAENTMLNSKLENEKQNRERLETEVESYKSRLATATQDHEQCQASQRDLQLAFQRERDEWFCLQDKMNFDMSNLKDNNESLCQELSKAESKFSSLESELKHTRDALRERTLVLEGVQRDLSQTQCQKKELEHIHQKQQGKVNKYVGKQGSLEEKLSHLQSENKLLRQQLDDAHNKADDKEKTVINIQDQFQDIIKILQTENEKQGLMLNERNKELTNECIHLKEIIHEYENDKAERDAVVRQLQQELADTLKKQSMSEASLEVTSHDCMNLEDEIQDLKKKLDKNRSQLQETQDRCTVAVRCAEETQDHMQKLEIENAKLKVTIKKQAHKIEQLQANLVGKKSSQDEKEQLKKYIELKQSLEYNLDQEMKKNDELEEEITRFKKLLKITERKLNEYENGELSFPEDLKPKQIEMDIQINVLKHKNDDLTSKLQTASSKCLRLDEENKYLQQELLSMKAIEKKCEKLQNDKKKWKQEVVNLKRHMEMNMVEFSEVQQYKQNIEERARQDVVEKLKEVNLFLQTQAASQENLEQLRENHLSSIRSQLELRIKDLESELSRMKMCQDSTEKDLGKYKQLYLEELEGRKSLAMKLNKTNERLAEVSTELLLKQHQNRSLLRNLNMRPVLETPGAENLHNSFVLYGNSTPRENLVIPTSRSRASNNSIETYLIKMQQEFEKTLTKELKEDAAEFESESYGAYPVGSVDQSNSYQDLFLKTSQEYVQILKKNYMI